MVPTVTEQPAYTSKYVIERYIHLQVSADRIDSKIY